MQRRPGVMHGGLGRGAAGEPGLVHKDNVLHVLLPCIEGGRGEHYLLGCNVTGLTGETGRGEDPAGEFIVRKTAGPAPDLAGLTVLVRFARHLVAAGADQEVQIGTGVGLQHMLGI